MFTILNIAIKIYGISKKLCKIDLMGTCTPLVYHPPSLVRFTYSAFLQICLNVNLTVLTVHVLLYPT